MSISINESDRELYDTIIENYLNEEKIHNDDIKFYDFSNQDDIMDNILLLSVIQAFGFKVFKSNPSYAYQKLNTFINENDKLDNVYKAYIHIFMGMIARIYKLYDINAISNHWLTALELGSFEAYRLLISELYLSISDDKYGVIEINGSTYTDIKNKMFEIMTRIDLYNDLESSNLQYGESESTEKFLFDYISYVKEKERSLSNSLIKKVNTFEPPKTENKEQPNEKVEDLLLLIEKLKPFDDGRYYLDRIMNHNDKIINDRVNLINYSTALDYLNEKKN